MGMRAAVRLLPVPSEHSLQSQIAKGLAIELAPAGKLSAKGVVWFAIDHANYGGAIPAMRIGRGIIAGLPDIWVLYRGRAYLIELKGPNGVLSEAQKGFMAIAMLAGIQATVADSLDQVLVALDQWGIPRNRRMLRSLP
jgi:hypothetical protein